MDILGNVIKRKTTNPPEPPRYADTIRQDLPEYDTGNVPLSGLTKQDYIDLYDILLGYKDDMWESIKRGVQSKNATIIRNDLSNIKVVEGLLEKISPVVPPSIRREEVFGF